MTKELLRCAEGTHDYFGDTERRMRRALMTASKIFTLYDYERIWTPALEPTELFARGIGAATDIVEKEMFTFAAGDTSLTLRPEGTAGVIRAYLQHNFHKDGLLKKLWYAGPMFRRERPQKGRQRQFYQIGGEAIGGDDPALDAEVIALAHQYFLALGIAGVNLRLNSIGCPDCRPRYREALKSAVAPRLATLCKSCQNRFERNPLRIVDCKIDAEKNRDLPASSAYLCDACREHFSTVQEFLTALNVNFTLDKTLVRGLDYYTKTVFEFTHSALGAQDALGGGGRYDGLVRELGDVDMPAVGFAIGVERVMIVLEQVNDCRCAVPLPVFGIALGDRGKRAICGLIARLRAEGIAAAMDFGGRSMKAQLRAANKRGALIAIIVGDSELEKGVVIIKDLRDGGGQRETPLNEFIAAVQNAI